MKNITLSVENATLEKAREAARKRGKSLNALVREYLDELAGTTRRTRALAHLHRLWTEKAGHSGGRKIAREEAYEGRA